jgi:amidase
MAVKRVLPIAAIAGSLLLTACVTPAPPTATPQWPQKPTRPTSVNEAAWDAVLSKWIAPDNSECDAPGGVLLVDSPAGRYLKAAGVASLEDRRPLTVDDRLQIGSNTKAFTVILALQLQEAGVLSMDDPLSKWLPELAARIPNGAGDGDHRTMTLRHLAGNTSGIWDYADPLMGPLVEDNDREGLARAYTPEELVEYAIANGKPDFAPGDGWHYSSTNFILLGMVVEAATGKSLSELYRERIFAPLGMESTSYLTGSPEQGSGVDGYYKVPGGDMANMTVWNATQAGAAGAIVSTAEDMARFVRGLFGGELFKSEATLDEMIALRELGFMEGGGVMAGYGLGLISFKTPGFAALGHAGQTPGFQSVWFWAPETETAFIFLTNSGSCRVMLLPSSLEPELFGASAAAPDPAAATSGAVSCANYELPFPRPEPDYHAKRVRDLGPFAGALAGLTADRRAELDALLAGATIPEMQEAMASGKLTSQELVTYYVDRIRRYDIDRLNSVMELNPQALEVARQLDAERAAGITRGSLHGIAVLLKDNIATGDGMHAAAGAYALKDWQPDRDAFLVKKLRDAGAVILGKANLSEWANYMDPCMPNGFSALGGQTRNPYGPFETYGSSSGSAVSVAANLAAASVGSETQGSIIMPAGINSVVALKTSLGLVSRDHIIPLLPWQDVPGPMGRTVTDVAVLLTAMAGVDANDPESGKAAGLAGTDFTEFLAPEALEGLRVGIPILPAEEIDARLEKLGITDPEVVRNLRAIFDEENTLPRAVGQALKAAGATVVEVPRSALPAAPDVRPSLEYGFREAIDAFLSGAGSSAPVGSLAEIVRVNQEDLPNRAPYGQGYLEGSQNTMITAEDYAAMEKENQAAARDGIDRFLAQHGLDVVVSDVGQAYAPAGYPALTVPAGYSADGTPRGAVFTGGYLSEAKLLAAGYAFEQGARARVAPDLDATMRLIETISTEGNDMAEQQKPQSDPVKPGHVAGLEASYGSPSQEGFGSAVFHESLEAGDDLGKAALAKYKYFAGKLWERYGEDAWMGPWKEVYARKAGAKAGIVAELRGITDPDASISVPMILDNIDGAEAARAALSTAYDDPAVSELRVYNLGDGAAMSGLLIAGRRGATGETIFLVFLLD